ncbi:MAG TPA: hypothetical protein VHO70_24215 [Chitinispirillaceae bacterium]|nr:hypothetical protein [Chitinispirillaceae bacterium]
MNTYPFSAVAVDSTYNLVTVRILQNETAPDTLASIQRGVFFEDNIEGNRKSIESQGVAENAQVDSSNAYWDTITPVIGGVVRLYSPRTSMDQTLQSLIFCDEAYVSSDTGFFMFADSSPVKITIRLRDRIVNAKKRTITALDCIQQWTLFVKEYPAQGKAMFNGVLGLPDFLSGKEALIRGLNAPDQRTIQFKYDSPQQHNVQRLRTPFMIAPKLFLGRYTGETGNGETILLPNMETFGVRKAFLDKIILKSGNDPNPILSFSLNKYDALLCNSLGDINYVRTTLAAKADLHKVAAERYFIACRISDSGLRNAVRSIVNPASLLRNYLKVEGEVIKSVGADTAGEQTVQAVTQIFKGDGTVKILFRNDDQVSKSVAEKLLADCSAKGISASLDGRDQSGYERGLVSGDYNCAVGWVAGSVLVNNNEKLRLASMWFENDLDEESRISDSREIPLFSVNTYLCCRKNVRLYRDELRGMYVQVN